MNFIKSYKRTFKIDLLTCFIGLILFTVIIVIYSYKVNSKHSLTLAKDLVNTTLNHAVSEAKQYLSTAQYTPQLTSILLSHNLNIPNDIYLEQRVIDVLNQSPFLFSYYIGDEKGNFILSYKNKYHSISTKLINNQAKKPFVLLRYRDQKNTVYQEKIQAVDYDPRNRPWYIGAKHNQGLYWTDVYSFFTKEADNIYSESNQDKTIYGISVSTALFNNKKQFIGAVGVDISLMALSDFLRNLKIGNNGKVLIVNHHRQLILFPWENSVRLLKGMNIEELDNAWLKQGVQDFFRNHQNEFFYTFNNQHYFVKSFDFSKEIGRNWYLIIVVPVDDFIGEAKQARLISLLMTSLMLLCSILLSLLLSKSLSRPLEKMTATMRQIKNLDFSNLPHLNSPIREFDEMSTTLTAMTQGLKAFLKYVPPEVVTELIKKGENVTLGGQEMNLTLFFSDIEGFTEITEETAPMELMQDLTYYFDQMVKVIVLNYQGTIDKYIGDSVMAFWGAPSFTTEHAILACHAALACQKEITQLNLQRLNEGKTIFNTRIGINTGMTIVGNIGSSDRFNYTVIGDSVNLASRLESLNKIYHTNIIVSHATYRLVHHAFVFRPLDFIIVKGKSQAIKVYQLLAEKNDCDTETLELVAKADLALRYYLNQDFVSALNSYQAILNDYPNDIPAKVMIIKCQKLIENPPDENWTGATRLLNK